MDGDTPTAKTKDKVTVIVFSDDLDKVLAAFNIVTGAASMGMEASMFFTFWGLNVLKRNDKVSSPSGAMRKMLARMNRGGTDKLRMSKFNMGGLGTWMMKKLMRRNKMLSVDEMLALAKQMGVKIIACTITMGMMGIEKDTLRPEIDSFAGVVTYLSEAKQSKVNLFI